MNAVLNMKPHLCIDARLIHAAGIGTFLKSSISALAKTSSYDLTFLCYAEEQKRLATLGGAKTILMKSSIYSLKEQFELLKKIPRCDLFWSPHFNVPLGPIRAKKRLVTIHDVYHLAHYDTLTVSQKIYAKTLYNAAFSLSDTVMTFSQFSKSQIFKYAFFKPKKLEIITPPLDFRPPSIMPPKQDFLLFVGNLKPHKNLINLVKAYRKLRLKNPLYIVGKKEGLITLDSVLLKEVENDPFLKQNVHFTGYVSEERLKELYAQAALFIFPSTYEGFGHPPLEAMACLCPVVAAHAASIPEVCGEAVEYIDPYSIDSIAEGIKRLLEDGQRREELIQKGKMLLEKKRSEKNQVVELIDACCHST